ncbi:MAG: c-type cytochrome [Bilophila wadsworthia]
MKRPCRRAGAKAPCCFALQCNVCHGLGGPRIDIIPRVRRLTRYGLEAQLQGQGTRLGYMPPFAGNLADRQALADYLERMGAQRQTIPSPEAQ